ncbi:unnamed protein product [Miscanthus lutarioriparius]|uniref:Uncharacterized protein n=1 Tax=Miscanthus lutarioriparius TaxID=422564 RepID=A0A811RUR8_9POAL|nr:unnamed protein product [Miscanthus lutarioriparius]
MRGPKSAATREAMELHSLGPRRAIFSAWICGGRSPLPGSTSEASSERCLPPPPRNSKGNDVGSMILLVEVEIRPEAQLKIDGSG